MQKTYNDTHEVTYFCYGYFGINMGSVYSIKTSLHRKEIIAGVYRIKGDILEFSALGKDSTKILIPLKDIIEIIFKKSKKIDGSVRDVLYFKLDKMKLRIERVGGEDLFKLYSKVLNIVGDIYALDVVNGYDVDISTKFLTNGMRMVIDINKQNDVEEKDDG